MVFTLFCTSVLVPLLFVRSVFHLKYFFVSFILFFFLLEVIFRYSLEKPIYSFPWKQHFYGNVLWHPPFEPVAVALCPSQEHPDVICLLRTCSSLQHRKALSGPHPFRVLPDTRHHFVPKCGHVCNVSIILLHKGSTITLILKLTKPRFTNTK